MGRVSNQSALGPVRTSRTLLRHRVDPPSAQGGPRFPHSHCPGGLEEQMAAGPTLPTHPSLAFEISWGQQGPGLQSWASIHLSQTGKQSTLIWGNADPQGGAETTQKGEPCSSVCILGFTSEIRLWWIWWFWNIFFIIKTGHLSPRFQTSKFSSVESLKFGLFVEHCNLFQDKHRVLVGLLPPPHHSWMARTTL